MSNSDSHGKFYDFLNCVINFVEKQLIGLVAGKIMKFSTPISMRNLIKLLPRSEKLKVEVPLVRLDVSQQNFAFKCTQIWNNLSPKVLEKCKPSENGVIIPGSASNSDLAASSSYVKRKLRNTLLSHQKFGNVELW